ncbi:YceD family protein [Solimicrobium silvestre]|uniref:Large ribosomal RNA subunit accumulation protein YceD n=1 Tax=Solimicrobium silvestre TaxID=2099400 RepID=A0A2S9GWW4_9BURK|nr:YceD family protein [Solimicrobium silvestre]PRC92209.1 hypothetical protein S2091_3125 [Solimicrobium silvestre]
MLIIDAFAFCRNSEQQTGKLKLSELARLRAECVSDDGEVEWTLVGNTHTIGYPSLQLTVTGTVQLVCQRCLTPYVFQISSDAKMLLAKDEQAADELDTSLEDDGIEVIVGSKAFDIIALIEDEALLAIPLSPKHEVCPSKEKLDAFATAKKVSPFAALKDQLSKN